MNLKENYSLSSVKYWKKKKKNFVARIYIIILHIYLSTLVHINYIYQSGVKFDSFTKSSNPHVLPDIFLLINLVSYCI